MTLEDALEKIKEEDSERAFRHIYDKTYERIFRTAYYYTKNDDDAREVAIDVLANVWNSRKTMIMPKDFLSYCFIAAKNRSLNIIRGRKKEYCEIEGNDISTDYTPEQEMIDEEIFAKYERVLYTLPERCREIFCLVKEEGHTYAEVAETLGISTKTVDAQIQKATKEIRKAFTEHRELDMKTLMAIGIFIGINF